jgi:hypothetical protein
MKGLKIDKKTKTKTEQIKLFMSILCLLNEIELSETEINILSYYIQYKISSKTDDLIIASGIVKNISILRNMKYRLCKKGFLKRDSKEYKTYELNGKDMNFEDDDVRLLIKLDNH